MYINGSPLFSENTFLILFLVLSNKHLLSSSLMQGGILMQQCWKEARIINSEKWLSLCSLPSLHLFAAESNFWKSKTALLFINYHLIVRAADPD